MASLATGIFDLASGNPTASEQNAFGDLSTFENNTGEGAINTGLGFENQILSGNPQAIAQLESPEIRAGQDQIQQQAEQNAFFGNRGGGTNSSNNAAQSNERGNIISLTGQLQQNAAQTELGAGENLLGQGSTSLTNEANLATQNRERQVGDVGGITTGAAEIAATLFGGGMTDPSAPTNPGGVNSPSVIQDPFAGLGPEPAPLNYEDEVSALGGGTGF